MLETAALNEVDLAENCRKRGFYLAQIAAWRAACVQANDLDRASSARLDQATKEDKRRIKEPELARKEKALVKAAARLVLRKKASRAGGLRSRMISSPDRQTAVTLINEVVTSGARRAKARTAKTRAEVRNRDRTLQCWTQDGQVHLDQRPLAARPKPANKLSEAERTTGLGICHSAEFSSLPPSQTVPKLADQGRYLASVQFLPHSARGWAAASPRPGQAPGAAQTTHQTSGQCALRGLIPAHVNRRCHAAGCGISPGCRGRWQAGSSTLSDRGYL